jgi:CheY-like chemotaxis protein
LSWLDLGIGGIGVRRVLVVDDDCNACSALGEILREEGYSVRTACNGKVALAELEAFRPDVVITDVRMPNIDGVTLAGVLAGQPNAPAVIFMTASLAHLPPGSVVVSKPVDIPALLSIVSESLELRAELEGGGS